MKKEMLEAFLSEELEDIKHDTLSVGVVSSLRALAAVLGAPIVKAFCWQLPGWGSPLTVRYRQCMACSQQVS